MTTKELIKYQSKYRNYDFKDKKKDEDIFLVLRRHWLTFIFQFMPIIGAVSLLVIIHVVLAETMPEVLEGDGKNILFFIESLAGMFLWIIVFVFWIDYYFDVWIITSRRIIDIEQLGLFKRNVSELEHSKVQDVTTEIHGILPTLLKYGFIYVQTAGKKTRFIFKQVPNPTLIRQVIVKLQKRAITEKNRNKEIYD